MQRELIRTTALQTILTEQKALANLKNSIDEHFIDAVLMLQNCKGRIVVTGIGKSALIAQKIVATFNSTGNPALFMHAADAIHGDIGMVTEKDCILCLSKSGNSPEIKVLVPLLISRGNEIVAVTSNKNSFLGSKADYVLQTQIEEEGEPNNLAPMTSTTLQLAMGDAIASALLVVNGFSSDHFAKFHPGGMLGKQLYLKVNDLAEIQQIPIVKVTSSLKECILEMTSKRLGATAVLDEKENLAGIITDGDLRRMLTDKKEITEVKAMDIMTANPITVATGTLAVEALDLLRKKGLSQLIIVDDKKVVGFVHFHDLLREGFV